MKKIALLLFASMLITGLYAQTTLVAYGSSWKYLANGSNQGTAWRASSFNDASWSSGNAQLGYGDGDEATVVSYGSSASNKHITTYFRKSLTVANASVYTGFTLNIRRDDGAVVYINGTERFRTNMPSGTISYTTRASSDASDDGRTAQNKSLPAGVLITGTNTIAVEIHQRTASSADISFDLQLTAAGDITAPVVSAFSPADNSSNVSRSANLVLSFNETVQKGAGNILIRQAGVISQTINVTSNTVSVTGSTVTINPSDFTSGSAVNVEIAAGAFKDLSNNNYAGIANASTWNFSVIASDVTAPTVTNYSPADNSSAIPISSNLVLTFSETVQKGAGNLIVKENGLTIQTIDINSAAVTVAGNTVTIDPANFANNANVNIEIAAGALKDPANNNYAGIANASTWNFTTVNSDITPPAVSNYSPADNSTSIAINSNLVLTFSETVQKGTGNLLVKENGLTIQTIDINSAAVTVAGNTVTIDPANFANNANVNIEIAAGALKDPANNNYAGIANASTWNFTTVNSDITPPAVSNYSPADNSTSIAINSDLVLTFNEPIQKATGNIVIREGGIITQTINVTSASVTVAGSTVTINPADFSNNTSVNIEIAAGVFSDLSNNNYAGISTATTWNFNTAPASTGPATLVSFGTSWKYLDNGTNQATAWRAASFDDAAWLSGNAQLGYGDGDESTTVGYGPSSTTKYITTYFRKTIIVSNPLNFASIAGSVKRDDGIAIYVNGTEVYRNNLAAGAAYTTLATLASDDGATVQTFSFSPSAFVSGTNVIAIELHQNAANSTDISFDLQLIGTVPGGTLLTRGPYLNMGNETAVTLRWRTDVASNSRVEAGTSFGSYPIVFNNAVSSADHEIRLTGLNPDTKYFYRFGSSSAALQQGSDNYFITAPPLTSSRKIRIAAFGDCGRNDNSYQSGTLTSYRNYTANNPAEVLLLLGDNAYETGTDAEYQSRFFDIYSPNLLKNHQLFPSPGNHDYAGSASRQADHNIPYNTIFTNPTAAECGGVASGTEAYYSWNWGNIHFLSLDSYGKENAGTTRMYDTTGAQAVWVKNDLAANNRPWVIVYWHHPPYTKGSHNSDTDPETSNIRQNFIRILERYGVDIIICGHSHNYERSYLLKNHFGTEATFNVSTHAVSNSSAKYNGSTNSCPYLVAPGKTNHGTVYIVAGSAGANGGIQSGYPHDAMPWSFNDGGMMYFEVEGNRLDAKFIRRTGVVADQFTILKDANKTTNLSVNAGAATPLTASWNGTHQWSTGANTQSITVNPVSNTTYTVSDGSGCVTDIFNVTINTGLRSATDTEQPVSLQMIPSFVRKGRPVYVQAKGIRQAAVVDISGRVVKVYKFNGSFSIETHDLYRGVYFLRFTDENAQMQAKKFIVTD